jgi:FkbM family methyltransferase
MATTVSTTLANKIARLRGRPDFQRNPARAVMRRLQWRLRWIFVASPWRLKLADDLEILAPRGGAGALIYYLGNSEPETAHFVMKFLKPGMVVWDVGAHIGEYSLLASRRVGSTGRVEAFEPDPGVFAMLVESATLNDLTNVDTHNCAIADMPGTRSFVQLKESSLAHLSPTDDQGTPVMTTTLDSFRKESEQSPDLVKVDVEGAEMLVLRGAQALLSLPAETAPVWVMEYCPENCTRFGYSASRLLSCLEDHGYRCFWLANDGDLLPSATPPPWGRSGNLVASKRRL